MDNTTNPTPDPIRRAVVFGAGVTPDRVAAYLPSAYHIVEHDVVGRDGDSVIIEGTDQAGWTLDDYIIPRLASGLMSATEIHLEGID